MSEAKDAINTFEVCLSFGELTASYVEPDDGEWIEEEALAFFRFEGTEELDPSSLERWCKSNIDLEFDGDLDDPDVFESIKAVKVNGPNVAEYGDDGLILEDVSFYLTVTSSEELDESQLDDLFHITVPTLNSKGMKMAFTDFESYEASFEEVPDEGKDLSAIHGA